MGRRLLSAAESRPRQKLSPAPRSTISWLAAEASSMAAISAPISLLTRLPHSGRLMVMVVSGPLVSRRTKSDMNTLRCYPVSRAQRSTSVMRC
jgi:hypothetical protein